MAMPDIPMYVFTGFLESGKTKFIQQTLEDPRFNTQDAYYKNKAPLTEILEKVFETQPISYWHELFDKNDLPHEVCRHFKEVPYDPQVQANHYAYFHEYPDGTKTVFTNGPVHFGSIEPSEIPCKEPGGIGRDSGEILKELAVKILKK